MRAASLLLVAVGGCALAARVPRPATPSPAVVDPVAALSPGPAAAAAPAEQELAMGHRTVWISADKIKGLYGKPIDEARRLLGSYGQTGPIELRTEIAYVGCAHGVVCAVNHYEQGLKVDAEDPIFLYVNAALEVAAPPPE